LPNLKRVKTIAKPSTSTNRACGRANILKCI